MLLASPDNPVAAAAAPVVLGLVLLPIGRLVSLAEYYITKTWTVATLHPALASCDG
jgi:hypothetical protein